MNSLPAQPILETKRLLLKELNPDIIDALFSTGSDVDIISFLGLPGVEALETEKTNWQQGLTTFKISFKKFLIAEKETNKFVGRCDFHTWHIMHRRAEIGYAITDETLKGKGYMSEALRAVIAFGFDKMQLNRIEAFTGKSNIPSLQLLKNIGFTEEGTLRSHYFKNGVIEDSVCFSLLQPEYGAIKGSWFDKL